MDSSSADQANPSFLIKVFKFIGKLWVIVTSTIGSLTIVGLVLVITFGTTLTGPIAASKFNQKVVADGGNDKIAIIHVNGIIFDETASTDPFSVDPTSLSATDINTIVKEVKADSSIKAVLIKINSPGGAVVASDEIYNSLISLKDSKPIVASLGDTAASGGYYVAAAANKIVANRATITGSIGVIIELPKFTELYNKIGVEMRTFKTGEFKDIGSPNRDLTLAENQIIQSILTDSYQQFIQAIVRGRNMPEDKVKQLADGRIFTGQQAKENGLVDELGNTDSAINLAAQLANIKDPTIVEYSKDTFLSSFLGAYLPKFDLNKLLSIKKSPNTALFYLMDL